VSGSQTTGGLSLTVVTGLAGLAVLGALWLFSAGAKAGRGMERKAREAAHSWEAAAVAVMFGAVLSVAQWSVLTRVGHPGFSTLALVLGVPAVLAGTTVGRMFATNNTLRRAGRAGRSNRKGRR
jgi:hypothetical protein